MLSKYGDVIERIVYYCYIVPHYVLTLFLYLVLFLNLLYLIIDGHFVAFYVIVGGGIVYLVMKESFDTDKSPNYQPNHTNQNDRTNQINQMLNLRPIFGYNPKQPNQSKQSSQPSQPRHFNLTEQINQILDSIPNI